jgi:hypothetical protein
MTSPESKKVPGPGNYEQNEKPTRYKSSPAWGMGSSKRGDLVNSKSKNNPGPTAYEMKSTVGNGPKYTSGQKLGSSLVNTSRGPGPGAYSPVKQDVGSSYTMGTKSKMGMSIAIHPEDGTHEKIAETWAFAPGPGQYQPNALIKNENKG